MTFTEQQVEQTIKDHISESFMYDKPDLSLENDLPLIKAGVIDSLGIFTTIAFLEQEFGFKVEPDDVVLENFETVDTIKSFVLNQLS